MVITLGVNPNVTLFEPQRASVRALNRNTLALGL